MRVRKAECPVCGELFGPLLNGLLTHLKDAHQMATEWYEAETGTIKIAAWLPGTLEFVVEV